eukprot:NODE_400_length_8090_cov_0.771522.p4 type:complete len:210 gc:universal NODE_400_length_8090_cov_0.771522:4536-5165(+)
MDPRKKLERGATLIHLTIRNSTQQLIKHLKELGNTPDVVKYANFWLGNLHNHHHHEDEIIFPVLGEYAAFQTDTNQFKSDHVVLVKLLDKVKLDIEKSEIKVDDIIKIQEILIPHLDKEEQCWKSENESMKQVPTEVAQKLVNDIKSAAKKSSSPFEGLMFLLYHLNKEQKQEFIYDDGGFILKSILVPFVFSRRNGPFLAKYATYDSY